MKAARTAAITASRLASSSSIGSMRNCEPRLDVSTRITLRKSTVRPWPSVSRPSSSTCSRMSNDLGVGLLDLVQQHDRVGPAAHGLGQLAALLVADVAGRRPDQPGDAVPLAVLAHVDADHGPLVVEQEVGERLGQLGLADAGRAEEQERAGGPVGVGDPGAAAAYGVADRADGGLLADQPGAEELLHPQQLLGLALQQPAGGDAGPGADDVGDVVGADLVLDHRVSPPAVELGRLGRRGRGELALQRGDLRRRGAGRRRRGRPRAAAARPGCAGRRSGP